MKNKLEKYVLFAFRIVLAVTSVTAIFYLIEYMNFGRKR